MKIALITQTRPGSDYSTVTAQLLISGPSELKVDGLPLNVFDTIELTSAEDTVIRRILSSGDSNSRDILNDLVSRIASSAFHKGDSVGHNEALMEHR